MHGAVADQPGVRFQQLLMATNDVAENENIRLQNLWDGIETMAALMTMPNASSAK
jgi:hypothetical protein